MGGTYFERPEEGGSAAAFAVDLDLLAAAARRAELARRPLVAVLDTSCVRTGLEYQLKRGRPPASLTTVRDGMIRLFMERDTLEETCAKLPEFAARFLDEVKVTARLQHRHIVQVLDFDQLADGTPFMVMERLRGRTLRAALRETRAASSARR